MFDASFPWAAFAQSLLFTGLATVAVFAVTFAVAIWVGRHAVVDVVWGLGFAVVALVAFLAPVGPVYYGTTGDVEPPTMVRGWVMLVLTVVWGFRLAVHIHLRSRGRGEDPRYAELMAKAPGNPHGFAFRRVYLTQAVVLWFVSLPVQVAMFSWDYFGVVAWAGVALWAVGMFFETVGDAQLTRFRGDPASRGRVLDTGLWRYTRHPNYFGDACVWWGLFLVAADTWPGVLTILSPLLMTWLLAKGTGAALLEKDIADRRPAYADYVRRTSGFVPLPPRKTVRTQGETA